MGILSFFKKPKQNAGKMEFPGPNDLGNVDDLEIPPPPPDMREDYSTEDNFEIPEHIDHTNESESMGFPDFGVDNQKVDNHNLADFHPEENVDDIGDEIAQNLELKHQGKSGHEDSTSSRSHVKVPKSNFIEINQYRNIFDHINDARKELTEMDRTFKHLKDEGHDEDKLFKEWHSQANDILHKLTYVDHALFEKD